MKKNIIILAILGLTTLISCSTDETKQLQNQNTSFETNRGVPQMSYKNILIGSTSAQSIGNKHNEYLEILVANTNFSKLTQNQVLTVSLAELPSVDTGLTPTIITDAINDFYSKGLIQVNDSISQINFQKNVLDHLVNQNEISVAARTQIDLLAQQTTGTIESKTNALINDTTTWTFKERQYFAVFTAIFMKSSAYWTANPPTSAKVSPAIVDAIGGILGMYGGPYWAYIQGALASYIVGG